MNMLISFIVVIISQCIIHENITLYVLNIYICQFYLNKAKESSILVNGFKLIFPFQSLSEYIVKHGASNWKKKKLFIVICKSLKLSKWINE